MSHIFAEYFLLDWYMIESHSIRYHYCLMMMYDCFSQHRHQLIPTKIKVLILGYFLMLGRYKNTSYYSRERVRAELLWLPCPREIWERRREPVSNCKHLQRSCHQPCPIMSVYWYLWYSVVRQPTTWSARERAGTTALCDGWKVTDGHSTLRCRLTSQIFNHFTTKTKLNNHCKLFLRTTF